MVRIRGFGSPSVPKCHGSSTLFETFSFIYFIILCVIFAFWDDEIQDPIKYGCVRTTTTSDVDPDRMNLHYYWSAGSVSAFPDPNPHSRIRKEKRRNVMFLSFGCSLWRAGGFSCSLDVLHKGLANFLTKIIYFSLVKFYNFCNKIQGSGSGSAVT